MQPLPSRQGGREEVPHALASTGRCGHVPSSHFCLYVEGNRVATDLATTVSRWTQSASGAQTRFTEGVQSTTKDPTALAVAAQAKLTAGFNDAVNSGRWARNLQAVGGAGWKAATVAKANNYSTGISAGTPKFQAAMQTWLPIIQSAAQQVQSMPNNSFSDALARSNAMATLLHNAKLAR